MIAKNQEVIEFIKKAGFSHIKLELEGNLNRFSSSRNGQDYNMYDERECQRFITDKLSEEARKAINFMMFYNDHSVDSELTFTLPVDKIEYAIEVINVWNSMVEYVGRGCDVRGAGMHFSVLTGPNYPVRSTLPSSNLSNFIREVTKLLPALYIGATSGEFTRGLTYRRPQITDEKYSAICTHNSTCLEYRIFETCYQRPETLYEYLGVIARTLEFYVDTKKKVKVLNKRFNIYEDKKLDGYTKLPEQVSIIKTQFKYLTPMGMTMREFMQNRGIKLEVKSATEKQKTKKEKLGLMYEEHVKAQKKLREREFNQYEKDALTWYKQNHPDMTEEWYFQQITGTRLRPIEKKSEYINNNLRQDRPIGSINV